MGAARKPRPWPCPHRLQHVALAQAVVLLLPGSSAPPGKHGISPGEKHLQGLCLPFGFSSRPRSRLHNAQGEAGLVSLGPPRSQPINRGSPALRQLCRSSLGPARLRSAALCSVRLGSARICSALPTAAMHTALLGLLGLALLGALRAQDTIPVQTDFQQDKVTPHHSG